MANHADNANVPAPALDSSAGCDVSVCIVNWNGEHLLRDLLRSLETIGNGLRLEVIIADNASSDGSVELLRTEFPQVRLIANSDNLGFARGNNQAAALATGRFLFFLNNDTVVRPGAIERLVEYLEEHPDVSGVGPRLVGQDGNVQRSCRRTPTLKALLSRLSLIHWTGLFRSDFLAYRYRDFDYNSTRPSEQIAGAALLVRRETYEACGGWDECFPFGLEDADLCVRLGVHGPLHFVADAEIIHYGRLSSRANRGFVVRGYECGYVRFLRKHARWKSGSLLYKVLITIDMPVRIMGLAGQYLWRLVTGRREKSSDSYNRLAANLQFLVQDMPRFWAM